MNYSIINERDYYQKVYGGWLGKNIGGTLGTPLEGNKEPHSLTFYSVLPDGPLENDDLDLQLVWLHALEQYGARLTSKQLGQEWLDHIFFPFDEYGYALTNLRRGLQAPVSGWFNNPFTDGMGSPIRSEIWAMIAPGAPGVAAYYAYQDAIIDHAGGEGVYGEMFFAAIESAAFLESDRERLIRIGLSFIPPNCRVTSVVHDILRWHREGKTWQQARELIIQHHGDENFTDAPQNIAFTILGWLYGEDFGDCILKAVNCGYDSDCTGATLGAILGIIHGAEQIPEQWVKPMGDRIVVSPPVKGFPVPQNLHELTQRTMNICKETISAWKIPVLIDQERSTLICTENLLTPERWTGDYDPRWTWQIDNSSNRYLLPEGSSLDQSLELIIDYGTDGPAIGQRSNKKLNFSLCNHSQENWEGNLSLEVPDSWECRAVRDFQLKPGEVLHWEDTVHSGEFIQPYYQLYVHIQRFHDDSPWNTITVPFTLVAAAQWSVWGPNSTQQTEAVFPGNQIDFHTALGTDEPGTYRAKSVVINPRGRTARIIVATDSPVRVYLNDELLIEDLEHTEMVPAYHRAPRSRTAVVDLSEGKHDLDIYVEKGGDPLAVHVLLVATAETKSPGPCYYFTDIVISSNDVL